MIYFDNAATTPMDTQVIEHMHNIMSTYYGNPSSVHTPGREARVVVEDARKQIAGFLNVSPSEIIFTSSGTEAINTVIYAAVNDLGVKHIITSPLEHHAVLHSVENIHTRQDIKISYLPVDSFGIPDLSALEEILRNSEKALVCLMHANNEIGSLSPIAEIGSICEKYGVYFLADTVQTIGKYAITLQNSKIHFATCSAHKFHGPKGVGFLYLNGEVSIKPYIHGGGQERNMRSGTENIYGIAGLAMAMEIAYRDMEQNQKHISELKAHMVKRLTETIPGIIFNADSDQKGLYNILNVSFPKTPQSEMLLYSLDIEEIAVSGGSACSSGSVSVSHVLKNIGVDISLPALRFSFSKFNTFEEVDHCIDVIKKNLHL
jgi:cysteine desulfurase